LLPPPLEKSVAAENDSFWSQVTAAALPGIETALHPHDPAKADRFGDRLLLRLHAPPEPNPNAVIAGAFYSRSLDFWGVELQRAGELEPAAGQFIAASKFNPDNVAATVNLDFNRALRAGTASTVIDLSRASIDQFGKYRNLNEVINANGPFDETSFCFEFGVVFARDNGFFRQAIAAFTRVRQLAPDNLDTRLELGQLYLFSGKPDLALEALHDPLARPAGFSLTETNSTELNILVSAAHFQKNETALGSRLLEDEIARHPENDALLTAAAQAYMMRGLYTNALRVIARKLAQTPDAPQWLFGKGLASIQTGDFNTAIAALTRVLEIQTNDPTARFNRALAYLQSDRLDQARADYAQLQSTYTNSFQVAFGLAEIGWRQHDTNAAIHNYQLYLANAPTNSVEFKIVRERLEQLRVR
jgi:tetratricopeptide (TPR) repeat protein